MMPAQFPYYQSPAVAAHLTFEQWLNRPVYKVQVYTAQLCNSLMGLPAGALATPVDHPIMLLRLRPGHRPPASLALRKQIADQVRHLRATGQFKLKKVSP